MKAETPSSDYRASIPRMVERIVERFHPLRVILFGSYATGAYTADSDVDFLVVAREIDAPDGFARREKSVEVGAALADFGIPNDVFVTTPSELEKYEGYVGFIFRPALWEGVTLYERPGPR